VYHLGLLLDIRHALVGERSSDNMPDQVVHGLFFPRVDSWATTNVKTRMAPSHEHMDQVLGDFSVEKQDLQDLVPEDHTPGQNG